MRSTTIVLGDQDYSVPPLTLGQFEELMEALPRFEAASSAAAKAEGAEKGPAMRAALAASIDLLAVMASEAEPPIGDMRKIPAAPLQMRDAINAVLVANGLVKEAPAAAEGKVRAARRAAA
jgi:hypothetical protein